MDDERERIRAEEVAKLERERQEQDRADDERADSQDPNRPAAGAHPNFDPVLQSHCIAAGRAWLDPARGKSFATRPDSGGYMMAGDVKAHPCVDPVSAKGPESTATIKLGDINARIAPLSISADGMSKLGFDPVNAQGAAKLYRIADLPWIIDAMVAKLRAASCE